MAAGEGWGDGGPERHHEVLGYEPDREDALQDRILRDLGRAHGVGDDHVVTDVVEQAEALLEEEESADGTELESGSPVEEGEAGAEERTGLEELVDPVAGGGEYRRSGDCGHE